jgi:2-polyprenyl-3-methyl-5-hydroxy-6-metoxy-1,4-benzoquinol methylase
MSSSLHRALLQATGIASADQLSTQERIWFDYADSSNERGETLISSLETHFTGPLRRQRVLDIGCGFGGCAIAAGRRGASVLGIDLSEKNLHLAAANLKDSRDLDVSFAMVDITQDAALTTLGRFDLIIADNVVEHVSSPAKLIANASLLLNSPGHLYVTAPNARSTQMVASECHYSLCAASLLDPHQAEQLLNQGGALAMRPYEVSHYLDFAQYMELFARYGLVPSSLLPESATASDIDRLASELAGTMQLILERDWGALQPVVIQAATRWQDEFDADLRFLRSDAQQPVPGPMAGRIMRDYGYALWYFVGRK